MAIPHLSEALIRTLMEGGRSTTKPPLDGWRRPAPPIAGPVGKPTGERTARAR
jgi:hypothetical protein